MTAALQASIELEALPACIALGVARATFYRYRDKSEDPNICSTVRPSPARSLSLLERETVLDQLTSQPFADAAPRQIWATLLDEGTYLCSISTMYRILKASCGVRERRDQLCHPIY